MEKNDLLEKGNNGKGFKIDEHGRILIPDWAKEAIGFGTDEEFQISYALRSSHAHEAARLTIRIDPLPDLPF